MKLIIIGIGIICLAIYFLARNTKNNKPYEARKKQVLYFGITLLFFSILA